MKQEISEQIFRKHSRIKFNQNGRVAASGQADGRTDKLEEESRSSKFYNRAYKGVDLK